MILDFLKLTNCVKKYNNTTDNQIIKRNKILNKLLNSIGKNCTIRTPVNFDIGKNTSIGDNFYSNHNFMVLDCNKIEIGDNVFVGPNCVFITTNHPQDKILRRTEYEKANPIVIKNDVWIGANVTILNGVTIGEGCIIGAGSVVTRDIPDNSIAYGVPCKVHRRLDKQCEKD